MRSSSTDPRPGPGRGRARRGGGADERPFLPVGRTAWLRLVLVVLLGVAAMLAPSAILSTGAFYTDTSTVSGDVTAAPTFTATPSPSPA